VEQLEIRVVNGLILVEVDLDLENLVVLVEVRPWLLWHPLIQ
tara:strand:+ start:31 stop:156 length:126 start_codon:yes stop_codon:yes gene_type:complete